MNKTTSSDSKGKVANHSSAHKVLLYLNVITDLRLMSNLAAVLKLYSTRLDARTVCICSSEGSELLTGINHPQERNLTGFNQIEKINIDICFYSYALLNLESRANSGPEDVEIITSLVSSFSSSIEQVSSMLLFYNAYIWYLTLLTHQSLGDSTRSWSVKIFDDVGCKFDNITNKDRISGCLYYTG